LWEARLFILKVIVVEFDEEGFTLLAALRLNDDFFLFEVTSGIIFKSSVWLCRDRWARDSVTKILSSKNPIRGF